MRKRFRWAGGALLTMFGAGALFAWNGLNDRWRSPEFGTTTAPASSIEGDVTLMAWNLAKCGFHRGSLSFRSADEVRERLDRIADVVLSQNADLLLLSEVVFEATPCPVNQVAYLAERARFHAWVYGDNYSYGVPGFRIRSGNAILSRVPLTPLEVQQLVGRAPFWNPTGNRRLLWSECEVAGEPLRIASLRNESFNPTLNARQVREILSTAPDPPVLLGGDFNAVPGDESMELWRASQRFVGVFDGPMTFPAKRPNRRIDTILVPVERFEVRSSRVLDVDLSDHEPVVVTVRVRDTATRAE